MDTAERLEVRHWVQEAISLYEREGKEKALARISDPGGPFIQGKRYVFALDLEGNLIAHPFSKHLVGQNLAGCRDSEGRTFIRKVVATAKNRGYGYAEYRWPVPDFSEELHKTVFFEQVDGVVFCSGFYTIEDGPIEAINKCIRPYGPC